MKANRKHRRKNRWIGFLTLALLLTLAGWGFFFSPVGGVYASSRADSPISTSTPTSTPIPSDPEYYVLLNVKDNHSGWACLGPLGTPGHRQLLSCLPLGAGHVAHGYADNYGDAQVAQAEYQILHDNAQSFEIFAEHPYNANPGYEAGDTNFPNAHYESYFWRINSPVVMGASGTDDTGYRAALILAQAIYDAGYPVYPTATSIPTFTPTDIPRSPTMTFTGTPIYTPSLTYTPSDTPTPCDPPCTPVNTPTPTHTSTDTPSPTNTFAPWPTNTYTPTFTPTHTSTPASCTNIYGSGGNTLCLPTNVYYYNFYVYNGCGVAVVGRFTGVLEVSVGYGGPWTGFQPLPPFTSTLQPGNNTVSGSMLVYPPVPEPYTYYDFRVNLEALDHSWRSEFYTRPPSAVCREATPTIGPTHTYTPTRTSTPNMTVTPCNDCSVKLTNVNLACNPDGTFHWSASAINKPDHGNDPGCTLVVPYRATLQVKCRDHTDCSAILGDGWRIVQVQRGDAILPPRLPVTLSGDFCYMMPSGVEQVRYEFALDSSSHACNIKERSRDMNPCPVNPVCAPRYMNEPAENSY